MSIIFFDGKWVKASREDIHQLKPGQINRKGAFETIGVYQGQMLFIKNHITRFKRALKLYRIKCPYSIKYLEDKLTATLERNNVKQGRIRLALWQDEKKTRLTIVAARCVMPVFQKQKKGCSLMISSFKRNRNKYSHIKSMQYKLFERASDEAKNYGCDEALLTNNEGKIVEGAKTNIFIVKNNCLITPPVKDGCLNGIVRQQILILAQTLGIKFQVKSITKRDLHRAQEIFLTNSFIGIIPVENIRGDVFRPKNLRVITQKLLNAYRDSIGAKK